ncbi:hypothetical protein RB595_001187 [Gaeumannomyces hyphopodioides]
MGSSWPSLLPLDIWYLVCQELAAGTPEFDALFKLALTSRVLAGVALPALYSVQDLAWVNRADLTNAGNACLWRSLALSSLGKTVFPYAHWIRIIKLGRLRGMLGEISRAVPMREAFFRGDMDVFHPRHTLRRAAVTRSASAALDEAQMDDITIRIGEAITSSVRAAADQNNKAVAVAELESISLPVDVLTSFISRLPTLRSLTLEAGAVLDQRVGQALRESCLSFTELSCYRCLGDGVDRKMAGFLLALAPNSLERFRVISANQLGRQTFTALARLHSKSLKGLHLSSLGDSAVPHLRRLSQCTTLEYLNLQCSRLGQNPPEIDDDLDDEDEGQDEDWFAQMGAWLRNSRSLTYLCIDLLPRMTALLADVLVSDSLRLKTLSVDLPEEDVDDGFFAAIGHQTSLEHLLLLSRMDPFGEDFEPLVQSVAKCKELVRLLLYNSLTGAQIARICAVLPRLEKFRFDGENMSDAVWEHLLLPPRLNSVDVNATSGFTFDGIMDFVSKLAKDPRQGAKEAHRGFGLSISSQLGGNCFAKSEEKTIKAEMRKKLKGSFSIGYWVSIDEDDEDNEDMSDEDEDVSD